MENQSFFVSVFGTIRKAFNYKGTASRQEYVYYMIFSLSFYMVCLSLVALLAVTDSNFLVSFFLVFMIYIVAFAIVRMSLIFRRCRDVWGRKAIYWFLFGHLLWGVFDLLLCFKKGKQ